jgi:hypothetical protein
MRTSVITLALGAAISGFVQPATAQLDGGLNLSRFVGGDATNNSLTKLHLGASIPFLRIGAFSIVPEIYYAQRGGDRLLNTMSDDVVNPLASFDLDYIEIPIILRLTVQLPGPFSTYFGGGPTFAWQLTCGFSLMNLAIQAGTQQQPCEDNLFSDASTVLAKADRGVVGNAGFNLLMGKKLGTVTLDFRVVQGLARVVEDQGGPNVRNHAVSLTLGYSMLGGNLVHIK